MKIIEYTSKRIIKHEKITESLCVYRHEIYVDNELIGFEEGVAELNNIENLVKDTEITNSEYKLYKKEILELNRTKFLFNEYANIRKLQITEPYTYVKDNGINEYEILRVSYTNHNIYNLENKRQPKAMFFDYIRGDIDNKTYNLDKVLDILKKRDDVRITHDAILDIPYYNTEYNRTKHIEFIWCPKDEDFEKLTSVEGKCNEVQFILDEILKLPLKQNKE